jgi:hypothetical protein
MPNVAGIGGPAVTRMAPTPTANPPAVANEAIRREAGAAVTGGADDHWPAACASLERDHSLLGALAPVPIDGRRPDAHTRGQILRLGSLLIRVGRPVVRRRPAGPAAPV